MSTTASGPAPSSDDPTVREVEPPLPETAFAVINPLVKLLLRSPFHALLSDSVVLLTFEGRRSGREFTTPVGYRREGDTLVLFTQSPWWRNLRGGRPVGLRLQVARRTGVATPISDPIAVADRLRGLIESHGRERARRLGIEIEGEGLPSRDRLAAAIEDTVLIEVELDAITAWS